MGNLTRCCESYKALEQENPRLIDPNSPTLDIGGGFATHFAQVDHLEKMMSLDNVFDDEELEEWFDRVEGKTEVVIDLAL